MFDAIFDVFLGPSESRDRKRIGKFIEKNIRPILDRIRTHDHRVTAMTDAELRMQTGAFRQQITEATDQFQREYAPTIVNGDEFIPALVTTLQEERFIRRATGTSDAPASVPAPAEQQSTLDAADTALLETVGKRLEQIAGSTDQKKAVLESLVAKADENLVSQLGEELRKEVFQHRLLRRLKKLYDEEDAQKALLKRLHKTLNDILPEAFAVVCEAAKRVVGMRPFDVQAVGGVVLHQGSIAEMVTGEGKTLVAVLPAYLNGLLGKGVHIVTVNDYLARRDREWMGPILEFLGLTVGCIQSDMRTSERQVAYRADVTWGTNNEFGFDYLRDNMAVRADLRVQRGLHYAIVDEVDSILIDEARTPLIISGQLGKDTDLYYKVDRVASSPLMGPNHMMIASDKLPDLAVRLLNTDDHDPVSEYLRKRISANTLALLEQDELDSAYSPALQALEDELLELKPTGRDSELAGWLSQEKYEKYPLNAPEPAVEVEEKEKRVIIKDAGMKMAIKLMRREQILDDDQDLFSNETIGTHHMLEQALVAHHHYKRDDEYVVMNGQVLIVDEFTGRMMEGRRYSDGLHQALEAKEANKNPHSGVSVQFETQTIASITYQNYFKLYVKLAGMTGTARTEAGEFSKIYGLGVTPIPTNLPLGREDQTDLVFASEQGKFKYIVRELQRIHETGRPILVGTVSIEKSEHLANMLSEIGVSEYQVLNAKHHAREATIIANAGKRGAITIATNMAGRGTDIKLAEGVREIGGLAVVGTERHESRRIDNQLRGRCGRQGDPGTTRFYVSLEDEVARLFGGDRAKKILKWVGAEQMDDEPLDQRMVSRSIEKAQKRVEEYNFEIREHLLKYAEVMNRQRTVIYEMRRSVLEARDISGRIREMFEAQIETVCAEYCPEDTLPEDWDLEGLGARFYQLFGFEFRAEARDSSDPSPLVEDLIRQVADEYEHREEAIERYLRETYREQVGGDESQIDFAKMARSQLRNYERMALLRAVDEKWIDHLHSMDYLRESVRLRAFGQKDPLLEYKAEGFELFEAMLNSIDQDVTQTLFRLTNPEVLLARRRQNHTAAQTPAEDPFAQLARYTYVAADKQADRSFASFDTSRFALAGQQDAAAAQLQGQGGSTATMSHPRSKAQPVRVGPKIGPNDPCPCGSGKKYKKCCGASVEN